MNRFFSFIVFLASVPVASFVASLMTSNTIASETVAIEKKSEKKPAKAVEPKAVQPKAVQPKAVEPKADKKETIQAGHSVHGEVFNEGPRQKAYLMKGTGNIKFPITTKSELTQKFFNQGVGQLHGFWNFEAERSFRQALFTDPQCAMAYWGIALANHKNEKRSNGFIKKAMKLKTKVTMREKMYIEALAAYLIKGKKKKKQRAKDYSAALKKIADQFPDDIEAKAFYALQQWHNRYSGIPIKDYKAVDAVLEEVLKVNPMHPVHHYRIHLWDSKKASNALASSALCGQSAPAIAHMWHMPGHIFSKLKRYDDAVWQQEASARVDHAQMIRDRVLPDQIHNFAHNNEWLIRNLVYIGRVRDAIDLAKNMTELPQHPKYNIIGRRGSANYGRMRLFEVLRRFELWDETIALCQSSYLGPTEKESEIYKRLRYFGAAYYHQADLIKGDEILKSVQQKYDALEKDKQKEIVQIQAKTKQKKELAKKIAAVKRSYQSKSKSIRTTLNALQGHQLVAQGQYTKGIKLLQKARGEDRFYIANLKSMAGDHEAAIKEAQAEVKSKVNQVLPLCALVEILFRADKQEEAKAAFAKLRAISNSIDMQSPVFHRISKIATALEMPSKWCVKKPLAKDIGVRPPLDSLGPFRWHPWKAPNWTLVDSGGKQRSLSDYQGRNVLVIFYLGFGCLHCAEQLQAFGPVAKDFQDAGISIIAVSSDDAQGLKKSIENYDGKNIPFPIVTNKKLNVFKAYRAFDDFENQTLHGTYLIDPQGRVLWHDISYEPFMDHKFLLKESKRLLNQQKATRVEKTAQSIKATP